MTPRDWRSGDIEILAVGGTGSLGREADAPQWYQLGHALALWLVRRGFRWLRGLDGREFRWSTRLAGHQFWRRVVSFFTRRPWVPSLVDWQVAGSNLLAFVCPPLVSALHWLPAAVTHLWLHSHAGNCGFFACADGLRANTFTTFCTPPRADMVEVIKRARDDMGYWIHVHSDSADRVVIAGTVGDGRVQVVHKFSELRDPDTGKRLGLRSSTPAPDELGIGPDLEIFVSDGHSGILNNPAGFHRLNQILDIIRSRHGRTDLTA